MKKRRRRWYGWPIGIACVLIAGGYGYTRLHRTTLHASTNASTPQYLVNRVQQGTFTGQVTGSGTIQAQTTATIQAPADGSIATLPVTLGQTVAAGATIATLSGGQSITSPMAGTVVSIPVASGAYVTAGETMVTVADLSTTYASVSIPEQSIRSVAVGQSATITVAALPDETFTGTVAQVGLQGTGSGGSVSYPVLIKISNAKGLLLGMSASATITTGVKQNAISVPTAAIQVVNGKTVVIAPKSPLSVAFGGFSGGSPQTSGSGSTGGFPGRSGSGRGGFGGFSGTGRSGGTAQTPTRSGASPQQTTIPVEVPVTIGLTNATSTQILSGLQSGEQVLIPNPAAASSTGTGGGGARFRFGGLGGL